LGERLGSTEVARLTNAQLYKPRDSVLDGLSELSVGRGLGTMLERSRFLDERLLWMQGQGASALLTWLQAPRP
jgi:hypothetical protein